MKKAGYFLLLILISNMLPGYAKSGHLPELPDPCYNPVLKAPEDNFSKTSTMAGATFPAKVKIYDDSITTTDWYGFRKRSFKLEGIPAFVVEPKISAPGKPWVWRTSFPDYHPEVDQELLASGCYVAYIDVLEMLGSDTALDIMDQFYDAIRAKWRLAEKPAMEAISRGGLHAYRYAARHPERIACIYADTPVMDLKSWPTKWAGSRQEVKDAFKFYGFKDEVDLASFRGNPVDLLQPIARAKIPLRHIISLNDKVVPAEENTLEARRRLQKLGSDIELVTTMGDSASGCHHFPLIEIFTSARFILDHAATLPGGKEFFQLRDGLTNSKAKFEIAGTGRIVFIGGSITYNPGWRDELMRYFSKRFPRTKFDFISIGIPSVGSMGHTFRLESDALNRGPIDLVFVEAAVNDHNYDGNPDSAIYALRGMEGVVRKLRIVNPMTDIVKMHFIHDIHLQTYQQGKVPYTIEQHERVADYYGCPSLNLSKEVSDRINAGEFTWDNDFCNLHPSPYGQRVYANSMTRMLDAAFAQSTIPKAHNIPSKPLDAHSFFYGRYGRLQDAKLVKGFILDTCWKPKGTQEYRTGFANCPALVADNPGAELSYTFKGTAFGFFIAAGSDTGIIEFSIDHAPFKELDTWTSWSGSLHLPWVLMLAEDLTPGKHKVIVRTTNKAKERCALHIIHILIN